MSQRRNQPVAYPILAKNTEENVHAQRGMAFRRARVFENYATTAAYVDSLIFDKRLLKQCTITIVERGGAQSVFHKILACIDPEDWHEILPETNLPASGHIPYAVSDSWAYVKLQAKNNSGSGVVSAFISGASP